MESSIEWSWINGLSKELPSRIFVKADRKNG
jgi:hypothetical protein